MFTGIVEETGIIRNLARDARGIRLAVGCRAAAKGTRIGDSIAVNGCCLTVAGIRRRKSDVELFFDLLEETWERTSFASLTAGMRVNLERSMRADGRWGGHFVTGHVDCTGLIRRWERRGADHLLQVAVPAEWRPFLVRKGSVAIDGISLTVAKVGRSTFDVWIIPHTLEVTNLPERRVGDLVNLETDLLAKYVLRYQKLKPTPPKT